MRGPQVFVAQFGNSATGNSLQVLEHSDRLLIALCDGVGSWGAGVRAAHAALDSLTQSLQTSSDWSAYQLQQQLISLSQQLYDAYTADKDEPTFSALVVTWDGAALTTIRAGMFGISLLRAGEIVYATRFETLWEQLVAEGQVEEHLYQQFRTQAAWIDVYTGPALGNKEPATPLIEQAPPLAAGDIAIIAEQKVLRFWRAAADQLEQLLRTSTNPAVTLQRFANEHGLPLDPCAVLIW